MTTLHSPLLQHPERIHPALWRGSQLFHGQATTVRTGFATLDDELPGHGWPLSSLIEIMPSQPGCGELRLLQPALTALDTERSIMLVNPPHSPHFHCWLNWGLHDRRLVWIRPQTPGDTLWAAEQILKHNACSVLLCWASQVHPASLRRLHLAARQSGVLFIMLRPPLVARQASPAPLRLVLQPSMQGTAIHIVKRQGPICDKQLPINFYPDPAPYSTNTHATLDQPLSADAQPGHQLPELVR
ncbi:translesion DNA synthesis-associated protein ImuA [Allopusillimonas ginsengisoli]|uniref:translesion DNA synthesis-associated protein ImuA n=1 Tax=Allopusillimonas ginsengisoli TaxID=453575 RepID=UPI0010C1A6B1|nr:translesion DNA synthesis-associated protein ImuA [Allopusillimonas ginsengisoli]